MKGRTLTIGFLIFLLIFAGGLYYANSYAYYQKSNFDEHIIQTDSGQIKLTNVEKIDALTSPLKIRICADKIDGHGLKPAENPTPLVAPAWFECFDAAQITKGIEAGTIQTFVANKNKPWGFDALISTDGQKSWYWRQFNECGEAEFNGQNVPANCPPFIADEDH